MQHKEWRRHAAIAGPAFGEANYSLVWTETLRIVHEWFSEDLWVSQPGSDGDQDQGIDMNIVKSMTQATMHIISSAGFGFRAPWAAFRYDRARDTIERQSYPNEKHDEEIGSVVPFPTALRLTFDKLLYNALVPDALQHFALRRIHVPFLSNQLKVMKRVFKSLEVHMRNLVEAGREESEANEEHIEYGGKEEYTRADLLRRLVQANRLVHMASEKDDGAVSTKKALTDRELLGNVFVSTCRRSYV